MYPEEIEIRKFKAGYSDIKGVIVGGAFFSYYQFTALSELQKANNPTFSLFHALLKIRGKW